MMTLAIEKKEGKTLTTDRGIFLIESLYYEDDIVMDAETGEIYFIEGSTTDENGELSELDVD